MGEGILQSALEVIGEVLLAGVLLVILCAVVCVLATPLILIGAARDHGRFWPSVQRRYESVLRSTVRFFERLPL